jgi:phosphatidate cytidylyltransferase
VASGLRQRVITALPLGLAVLGILLFMSPWVAVAVIALIFLAGAWEWAGLAGAGSALSRFVYVLAVAAGLWLGWTATADADGLLFFLRIAALWWLVAFFWIVLAPQRGGKGAAAVVGWLVLVSAAVSLARLAMLEPNGRALLLFMIVLIVAADVGAYFGGRQFGRSKLAPRVSPGKTWEGFAVGMLAATAVSATGAYFFGGGVLPWLALGVMVALVSVIGDLTESMFKRRAGLKDSSGLLPGHGGVLDRVDSVTAAAPVFLLGLHAMGIA